MTCLSVTLHHSILQLHCIKKEGKCIFIFSNNNKNYYYYYRKHLPIWYPPDRVINSDNLLVFLSEVGGVKKEEEEEKLQSLLASEEWDSVGWSLWEKAEKEKAGLEETNQKLNKQIQELRSKIEECKRVGGGGREKREDDLEMFSLLGQVDGFMGQLLSGKGDGEN